MPSEPFAHKPLANFLRGVSEESEPQGESLRHTLANRGLDSDEVVSQIESRISAFLQQQHTPRPYQPRTWKHHSVRLFAAGEDAVEKMISLASDFVLKAMEGIKEPTAIDPFYLAEKNRISVVANESLSDARLAPTANNRWQIEFNPTQPKARVRFSIAHEIAHTFFPDWQEAVRNRLPREQMGANEWELEMLCNIGAAELLMPVACFPQLRSQSVDIDTLEALRKTVEVSAEALLSRVARVTLRPCLMFSASRIESGTSSGRYRVDYVIHSRSWRPAHDFNDQLLPRTTVVGECTAIQFTAKGDEAWPGIGPAHVECIGVMPYPGMRYPRVVGIVQPRDKPSLPGIEINYLKGDASQPRGSGPRIIAYNVNDKALSWGKGVSRAVAQKWPHAQESFRQRVLKEKSALRLGNTFSTELDNNLWAFQMVCQHGYGPSAIPRIRYGALKCCLDELARFALERNATVHMPRLGTGEGGAPWGIVSQIVDDALCRVGVPVTVYDLPNATPNPAPELPGLFGPQSKPSGESKC